MNIKLYLWWIGFLATALLHDVTGEEGSLEEEEEGSPEEEDDKPENPLDQYFYLADPESPIVEYERVVTKGENDRPDFIYNPERVTGLRLVEFYAHWCPHCWHFKDHYIEFGRQMKKLTKQYGIEFSLYAVSCVPHRTLCNNQNISSYPMVKLFRDGEKSGNLINVWELHPFEMLRTIGVEVDLAEEDKFSAEQEEAMKKQQKSFNNNKDGNSQSYFLPRTKTDIYNDAYLSFDFAMRNAIFMDAGPLGNTTIQALEGWLKLLRAGLPPIWGLQTMVSDLIENIDDIVLSEKNLLKIVKKHPPKKKSWSRSCTRGDGMAGYTCGLWELFHIVSVGLVEWNDMAVADDDYSYYRPLDSAETLRDYVEHFFGCEVCRLNFLHAFDACAFDRCNRLTKYIGELEDWKELPMWLFETHNGVNVRLMRERADQENRVPTRQDEFAVQWPSSSECPMCWHADGRWDPEKVYMFLRLTYWPEDEKSVELRRELFTVELEDDDMYEEEGSSRVFLLVLVGALVFTGASWYQKRLQLARTGHHKKFDSSYSYP